MADQINTTADMLAALQTEIDEVKAVTLEPEKARLVLRGRKLQLDLAALNLQYHRLNRSSKPSSNGFGLLTGAAPDVPATNGNGTEPTK
jgi:hypothetical protein